MDAQQVSFNQVISKGYGIDVHQKVVVATIDGAGIKRETREFGTTTRSLTELRDWLLNNGTLLLQWKVPEFIGNLCIIF